jgi:hypothetical protein
MKGTPEPELTLVRFSATVDCGVATPYGGTQQQNAQHHHMGYKPTLFDRHGPAALAIVRAWGYGLITFGLCLVMFGAIGAGMLHYSGWILMAFTLGLSTAAGGLAGSAGWLGSKLTGDVVHEVFLSGSGTPYQEQFSYEQALVMKGDVAGAIRSFEDRMARADAGVDVRLCSVMRDATRDARPARIRTRPTGWWTSSPVRSTIPAARCPS